MNEIRIRRADISDAEIIANFNAAMAKETEALNLDMETLLTGIRTVMNDDSHGYYMLAEIQDQVVGCMLITYEWSDWRNGQFWWIQSVYVNKQFRRLGIFKTLYNNVKEKAKKVKTCVGLRLYVENNNDQAQQTYEALGMAQTHYTLYEDSLKRS